MLKHIARLTSACLLLAALLHSAQGSRCNSHPLRRLAEVPQASQTHLLVMLVSTPQTHTVQAGETLWGISQRYGIDYKRLASMNERLQDATIRIGDTLKLPGTRATADASPAKPRKTTGTPSSSPSGHVVEKGETLYRIAQRHGVTVAALMKANQIDDPAKLRVGQQLKLPGNAQPPQPPKNTIAARPPAPEPVKPKVAPTPEEEAVSKALETVASTASAPKPPVTQPASPPPSQEPVLSRQLAPLTSATPRPAPAAKQLQPTPPPRPPRGTALITHIVEINDSLEDLATHFGQTVDQILFENPRIRSNRDLRVGAPLKIRVPAKF